MADIVALGELAALGLVRSPRFVPPWVADPRSLFALLTVSPVTSRIDLKPMAEQV